MFSKAICAVLLGFSFHLAGCANGGSAGSMGGSDTTTGGAAGSAGTGGGGMGGTGGTGGMGGSGGVKCVPEVCDGVDNNCDGVVDEGCECLEGDSEPCYSGEQGTEGVGPCKAGTRTCDPATNKFGPCTGEVLPKAESCDGKDEDCDGMVDDGLPDLMCGVGACLTIAPSCVGGKAGTCIPGTPSPEVCDGIDNNCNQLTDESFPESGKACDTGKPGVCAAGTQQCLMGVLTCAGAKMASNEVCDGLDNDCDGVVDNNIPGTGGDCSTGAPGVCAQGKISCQKSGGVFTIDCFSVVPSGPEMCDGLDNNCNGMTDEGNPQGGGACQTGQPGACAQGTLNCVAGAVKCTANAQAQPEVCDGADNNCDGQVDEGNPGAGQSCSCGGNTVCNNGLLFCQGCTKEVDCNNGLDDDGDNLVDCADPTCALGCNANVGGCPAGQKLLVLSSTDVPKNILDLSTVSSVINFTEATTVKRVVLQFDISHSFDADLDITLKSPSNTTIDVTSDNGGSGINYSGTIFNDSCGTPVASGSAPFSGCFSPEAPLSTFNNQPLKGAWTLVITDDAGGDVGTLNSWSLAMCVQ